MTNPIKNIKKLMNLRGMSIKMFASSINEPEELVNDWLNGLKSIPIEKLPIIAKKLDSNYEQILDKPQHSSAIDEHKLSLKNLNQFLNFKTTDDTYIYRGQSHDWPLMTSFCRYCNTNRVVGDRNLMECEYCPLKDFYKRSFFEKIKKICSIIDTKTNFINMEKDSLFAYMQHHGLPTPLLDWTYSPYIALYFALENASLTNKIVIYRMNLSKYKKLLSEHKELNKNNSISILEIHPENDRQLNQQGIFIKFLKQRNIELYFEFLLEKYKLKFLEKFSFLIDVNLKIHLLKYLKLMNINTRTLFPDSLNAIKDNMLEIFYDRLIKVNKAYDKANQNKKKDISKLIGI